MSRTPATGRSKAASTTEFVSSAGIRVTLKPVDPLFIQAVSSSVKIPKHPVYEVKTASGRIETHKMDKLAAAQLENGQSIWDNYIEELAAAQTEQSDRILRAILYTGAECELPGQDWEKKFRFIGIDIPDDPDERRVFYLMSELTTADTMNLMTAVMRMTGVDEAMVVKAEEAFRNTVPN